MDFLPDFLKVESISGWSFLLVLAMIALVLEIVLPSFIFLGLSIALGLGAAISWLFDPGPLVIATIVAVAWFLVSFILRYVFPSSGEISADGDPNTYKRTTPWVVGSKADEKDGDSARAQDDVPKAGDDKP